MPPIPLSILIQYKRLGIYFENGDSLVRHYGIGGVEYSFMKKLDYVKIGEKTFPNVHIDFGHCKDLIFKV